MRDAPECVSCDQLKSKFHRLERDYAAARGYLKDIAATSQIENYSRAKEKADDAGVEYEVAKIELERHQRTHETTPVDNRQQGHAPLLTDSD